MSRRPRFIVHLIAGGASVLPLFAYGHGGEFLEARLDTQNGVLQLNLIAEYGNNPMIADEAEARRVLADALRIQVGPTTYRLDELSSMEMAPRSARDPESPMPASPPDPGHAHQLLGATWRWGAPEGEVSFLIPETTRQSVLFWLHSPAVSPPRWMMLVPGEMTPAIPVEHPWWRSGWVWGGLLLASLGVAGVVAGLRKRRKTLA